MSQLTLTSVDVRERHVAESVRHHPVSFGVAVVPNLRPEPDRQSESSVWFDWSPFRGATIDPEPDHERCVMVGDVRGVSFVEMPSGLSTVLAAGSFTWHIVELWVLRYG